MEIKIGMEVKAEERNLARERVALEMPDWRDVYCLSLSVSYSLLCLIR